MAKKRIGGTPVFGPDVPDMGHDGQQKVGPGGAPLMKRGAQVMDPTGQPAVKGGREFDFCLMPASVSLGVQVAAAHIIGPALVKAMDGAGATQEEQAVVMAGVIGDFTSALATLPPGKVLEYLEDAVPLRLRRRRPRGSPRGGDRRRLHRQAEDDVVRDRGGAEDEPGGFFSRKPLTFTPRGGDGKVEAIESANINWYLMRPVMREPPLCRYAELHDGTYTLNQLADLHEAMDEEAEYRARRREVDDWERE